jgi:hypothetical protein
MTSPDTKTDTDLLAAAKVAVSGRVDPEVLREEGRAEVRAQQHVEGHLSHEDLVEVIRGILADVAVRIANVDGIEEAIFSRLDGIREQGRAEVRAAEADVISAIRALHSPDSADPSWCKEDGFSWPCMTARTIDHQDGE